VSGDLTVLSSMAYPGRIIIIGRDPSGKRDVVVYAVTGRSPSSRARRLALEIDGTVRTEVTDPELLRGGNEQLLLYRCLRPFPGGLAVSNGAQTDLIAETAQAAAGEPAVDAQLGKPAFLPAVEILQRAFREPHLVFGVDVTAYEPDPPAFTPRISGCLTSDAGLAIVRRLPDGGPERRYFPVPLIPGEGRLLATYAGEYRDPLPPFEGNPQEVELTGKGPQQTAEAVFEALGPKRGPHRATVPNVGSVRSPASSDEGPDLRVGVAVLFRDRETGRPEAAIINRTENGA